jgi:YHS domain-containing protein
MIIRFLIFAVLFYLFYKIIKTLRRKKSPIENNYKFKPVAKNDEDLVEDPLCHTYIPVSQAYKKEIAGQNHYFCSKECSEEYILKKSKENQ